MSGAATIAAVAAVASVGATIYNGMEQKKSAGRAADQAEKAANQQAAAADKQAQQAEEGVNRANQKKPDVMGILSAAQQAGKAGAAGTMLTGPQGIDPSALQLGKNTLLGQ
ncbi:MAG TPA: hypothetical protein VF285_03115 [Castellaniella sp.]|uniref:hypothetical protein n=1 Tax=Castellaniella sp. TaxID=1955812 RepID=UPI002EFCFA19